MKRYKIGLHTHKYIYIYQTQTNKCVTYSFTVLYGFMIWGFLIVEVGKATYSYINPVHKDFSE